MIHHRKPEAVAAARKGVAAVEFAVCVPVLVLLFLGSIECANMIYLKQTLTVSGYEGVRKAIQYNSTTTKANNRARNILDARQIKQASVQFSPSNVASVNAGDPIEVTVSAPCDINSVIPLTIFAGHTLTVTIKMIKE